MYLNARGRTRATVWRAVVCHFGWLGDGPVFPGADLRVLGWQLVAPDGATEPDVALIDIANLRRRIDAASPHRGEPCTIPPHRIVVIDVEDSAERGRLLTHGFGEAVAPDITLGELQARARRLSRQSRMLPARRQWGRLRLDLLAREGFVDDRLLGLHPREFLLLWRLMDAPDRPVDKATLLRDVWHLSHMPGTNSLAVHVSRLRAKLALSGLGGMLDSVADGGYRLISAIAEEVGPDAKRSA